MASAISYEYLKSREGVADGLATLDSTGKVPVSQLPDAAIETYKGEFADEAALILAYPTAFLADYAYNTETSSYWYWNDALGTPAWVNQEITEDDYLDLTVAERAAVPYIIGV
ncbi:MAG: hypothetical protein PHQ62_04110 [Clostridia bacterium]|nr:hypothetical protein [Clostridia bacterium]